MLDAYRDLIDELIDTPTAVKRAPALVEVGAADGRRAAASLRRLVDADTAALVDLQRLTREPGAVLTAPPDPQPEAVVPISDPDVVPDVAGETDPAVLVAAFDTARGELVSLLMNLTLKDWEATGIDADGREVSVADLVERHVELDESVRAELGV